MSHAPGKVVQVKVSLITESIGFEEVNVRLRNSGTVMKTHEYP
jgi:hypothetical protein